jgi:hypothetical protein
VVYRTFSLKLKSRFTRRIGQSLNATVIAEARTIERDRVDSGSLCLLGNACANDCCSFNIAATFDALTYFFFQRRRRRQYSATIRTDDLRINMTRRTVNAEAIVSYRAS